MAVACRTQGAGLCARGPQTLGLMRVGSLLPGPSHGPSVASGVGGRHGLFLGTMGHRGMPGSGALAGLSGNCSSSRLRELLAGPGDPTAHLLDFGFHVVPSGTLHGDGGPFFLLVPQGCLFLQGPTGLLEKEGLGIPVSLTTVCHDLKPLGGSDRWLGFSGGPSSLGLGRRPHSVPEPMYSQACSVWPCRQCCRQQGLLGAVRASLCPPALVSPHPIPDAPRAPSGHLSHMGLSLQGAPFDFFNTLGSLWPWAFLGQTSGKPAIVSLH